MAELSINNNTLLTPLTAIFPQWLITLPSLITITLTLKTNIVQILTIKIVSYMYVTNSCQLTQKLRDKQQLLKLK